MLKGNFASSVFHSCNAKTQKTQICVTGVNNVLTTFQKLLTWRAWRIWRDVRTNVLINEEYIFKNKIKLCPYKKLFMFCNSCLKTFGSHLVISNICTVTHITKKPAFFHTFYLYVPHSKEELLEFPCTALLLALEAYCVLCDVRSKTVCV
jgi:hypothetical protein